MENKSIFIFVWVNRKIAQLKWFATCQTTLFPFVSRVPYTRVVKAQRCTKELWCIQLVQPLCLSTGVHLAPLCCPSAHRESSCIPWTDRLHCLAKRLSSLLKRAVFALAVNLWGLYACWMGPRLEAKPQRSCYAAQVKPEIFIAASFFSQIVLSWGRGAGWGFPLQGCASMLWGWQWEHAAFFFFSRCSSEMWQSGPASFPKEQTGRTLKNMKVAFHKLIFVLFSLLNS